MIKISTCNFQTNMIVPHTKFSHVNEFDSTDSNVYNKVSEFLCKNT